MKSTPVGTFLMAAFWVMKKVPSLNKVDYFGVEKSKAGCGHKLQEGFIQIFSKANISQKLILSIVKVALCSKSFLNALVDPHSVLIKFCHLPNCLDAVFSC